MPLVRSTCYPLALVHFGEGEGKGWRPRMGMMHSTSGKHGYSLHWRETPYEFTKENLITVLKLEDSIRASPAVQKAYSQRLHGNAYLRHIRDVTLSAQRQAILEADILQEGDRLEDALTALHNHRVTHVNDEELRTLSVYGRYDQCWAGTIQANDTAYNARIHNLDGSELQLEEIWSGGRIPTLVIASSLS